MKRRDFLKNSVFFAAVSTIAGKATGIFTEALAADTFVTPGKLGYKEVSPQAKNGKTCATCKHYKAENGKVGFCNLPTMKIAMKVKSAPKVKAGAYCNMWAKIA